LKIFYKRKIITFEDSDIYQTESPAKVPPKQPKATVKKKHIRLCSSFFSDASHQSPKRPEEESQLESEDSIPPLPPPMPPLSQITTHHEFEQSFDHEVLIIITSVHVRL